MKRIGILTYAQQVMIHRENEKICLLCNNNMNLLNYSPLSMMKNKILGAYE